ncbi:hypothetical protein PTSG_03364 [Salpingoeca rosetta]|uniref:IBB domain-containing protein n=1 Tax=Salpingoeca rosetta (strain ATCC 50818 / BSB-021) TaxID=946362 RepID=F2U4Y7_SALR5|nr:uncharacterized protein PTSG_03364 [Salpingoeca rosetta]EGD82703.1 hypothetical protein PTSG_03364 [Salpingoeca rosetta]|eukprot:XP_004995939.1 hypothetical protein PTSG_03364 [Salpingoeca rosetta]
MSDRKDAFKPLRSRKAAQQRHKERQRDASHQRRMKKTALMHAKRMIDAEDASPSPTPMDQDAVAAVDSEKLVEEKYRTLRGGAEEERPSALQVLRDVFRAEPDAAAAFLRHDDATTVLVNVLKDPACALAACECITNLAASPAAHNAGLPLVVPTLQEVLAASTSPELTRQACWAIGNIAADGPEARDAVVATPGCVDSLMQLLKVRACVCIFPFADEKLFDLLEHLLQLPSKVILLETAWFIGNLAGANPDFAAGIFQHDLLIHLRNLLEETTELQREVSFAVLNMATSNPTCIDPLIKNTFHTGMYALLKTPDFDCTLNCLGFVDVLMTEYGPVGRDFVPDHVVDVIESLQYSDAANIKALATSIVERHFNYDEEEDDANLDDQRPAVDASAYPESRLNASFNP